MKISYKDAGVDIEKGDALVEKIKNKVKKTYGDRVAEGVGGFACLYKITKDKLLAAGTDGVGTKLKIAQMLDKHDTIGIDLVAMCVNDIICTGATPLFFMDYLATGKLNLSTGEQILDGIVEGCELSEMALIGGETAEMPGMYKNGEYDLAGFAVGEVFNDDLIDGSDVSDGDIILGISSSGIHSNGYSLVRKLIDENESKLLEECLTPTKIYWDLIKKIKENDLKLNGIAHITGGGISNIGRINSNFDYNLSGMPKFDEIHKVFKILADRSGLDRDELYKTFNMGVGLAIIVSKDKYSKLSEVLNEQCEKFWKIGTVVKGSGVVKLI